MSWLNAAAVLNINFCTMRWEKEKIVHKQHLLIDFIIGDAYISCNTYKDNTIGYIPATYVLVECCCTTKHSMLYNKIRKCDFFS